MREINIPAGTDFKDVISILSDAQRIGKDIICNFNGNLLNSNNFTIENAYKEVYGMTKQEFDQKMANIGSSIGAEKREDVLFAHDNIETWIKEGSNLIVPGKEEEWTQFLSDSNGRYTYAREVPTIIQALKIVENDSIEKAFEFLKNVQGMDTRVIADAVFRFSKKGPEFMEEMLKRFSFSLEDANKIKDLIGEMKAINKLYLSYAKESEDEFNKVDAKEYAQNIILKQGVKPKAAQKFSRIVARPGIVGERITTYTKTGLVETVNEVKLDPQTNKPGWVVAKVIDGEVAIDEYGHKNEWIISDSTFSKKYDIDPEDNGLYKPKGDAQLFIQINENITFPSPWGGDMNIKAGGYLNVTNMNKVYGVAEEEFKETYKFIEEEYNIKM